MTGLLALAAVLAATTAFGLWWRSRNGRVRAVSSQQQHVDWAGLGVRPADAPVTLVQFSSAFCAPCRATRATIAQVRTMLPAVAHVEVDAEQHLDAVRALNILRTPTVLVLDREGSVVKRASGQPSRADVIAAVAPYLEP
jgi:thiol-disulfide isomerase/thioredoxin